MRYVGRATRLAAASALLFVLGACSDESDGARNGPSATPTTASPSPSPTVTAAPRSDREVASQAALEKVREYYDVRDRLRQDPSAPLKLLRSVAISVELDAQRRLFERERSEGFVQTGDTRIAELVVQSVDLDNSDPEAGRAPTVEVDVCYDVSDVDVVDADGKSVVSGDRPDRGWVRHSVSNYRWDADRARSWRVASSETLERSPCDAP